MTKKELRLLYKKRRLALDDLTRIAFEEALFATLKTMDWSGVNYIHVYLPIQQFKEPDTLRFKEWLQDRRPDVRFVVSRSDFESYEMIHYLWDEQTVFEANKWGVLEPVGGVTVEESVLDVVIVPLLVVDIVGNRVGYGKGFYDRFLARCRPDVATVGLSYYEPVDCISDVGEFDIPIKTCVTPRTIHHFST
ncbi:5-formyltetrahydrofolate cyclo-ligase [Sphingobacterium tabacisoli]|uniref:5-formyltetrahydrofolate cyclo-ligase n=1 Tax=Sphingobacterium tabacisoli TaxID=2044855 RepID=A0ABW5KZ25_9SPHI|nr:5-formyltetrahydrofolate cyclo-ligase [Sphingobacterium tabacisoli]